MRDIEERLRKRAGNGWIVLIVRLQSRCVLRERFDEGHAKRPDIAGSGER